MLNNETIENVRFFLQDQNFLQNVFYQVLSYDKLIGTSYDGNYSITPDLIFPIETSDNNIYSILTFNVSRENGFNNKYRLFFQIYDGQYELRVMYPGEGNADYFLFNDVYPHIVGLVGENSILKNIKITNNDDFSWSEDWTFLSDEGEITKTINFFSSPDGGTTWNTK